MVADDRTKSELDLLQTVEEEQVISQAAMSERMGIAAGLVNFLMKRAISKGFVVAKRVPARRYAYFLTPQGMVEKARLVADYLNTSLRMFRDLRADLDELFDRLSMDDRARVIVVGDIEIIELAVLATLDTDIDIVGVVCDKTNRETIAGVPVMAHSELPGRLTPDMAIVVADIYHAQTVYDELAARYGADRVFAPKSLHVDHGPHRIQGPDADDAPHAAEGVPR